MAKRRRKTDPGAHAYGVPVPEALHEAIESERSNLAKAESLLGCLMISLESGTDNVTGPYYPDVAEIARNLVRQSINGLDSLTLQQRLLRNTVKEDTDPWIGTGVRSLPGPGTNDMGWRNIIFSH